MNQGCSWCLTWVRNEPLFSGNLELFLTAAWLSQSRLLWCSPFSEKKRTMELALQKFTPTVCFVEVHPYFKAEVSFRTYYVNMYYSVEFTAQKCILQFGASTDKSSYEGRRREVGNTEILFLCRLVLVQTLPVWNLCCFNVLKKTHNKNLFPLKLESYFNADSWSCLPWGVALEALSIIDIHVQFGQTL